MGEPVDWVAEPLNVRDRRDGRAESVNEGVLPGADPVALGHDRLERGRGGQGSGNVLEPGGPLVDPVVAGERVASSTPPCARTSTPTPAGPPHLCAEPATADHASGSGSRPNEAQALDGEGYAVGQARGDLAHRLGGPQPAWLAELRRPPPTRRACGGDVAGSTRPRRSTGSFSTLGAGDQRATRRMNDKQERAHEWESRGPAVGRAKQDPVDSVGAPDEVKVTSSGRTPRHSATTARAVSRSGRADRGRSRGGAGGSAYPWASAGVEHLARRRG